MANFEDLRFKQKSGINHLVKWRQLMTDHVAKWQDLKFKHKIVR